MKMENVVEVKMGKEYILMGDISGSMSQKDPKCGGHTRYAYMLEKFQNFIKQAEDFDECGPTVILFGEDVHTYEETTLEKLMKESDIQSPTFEAFTNLDKAIEQAYKIHKDKKNELHDEGKIHPGTVCMIFTDGQPSNKPAVERVIVKIANSLDREDEFNIYILTVGTIDAPLQDYLDNLHDGLEDQLTQDFDIIHINELEKTKFTSAVKGHEDA
jgi:Mg-chelatase subunit ChlD